MTRRLYCSAVSTLIYRNLWASTRLAGQKWQFQTSYPPNFKLFLVTPKPIFLFINQKQNFFDKEGGFLTNGLYFSRKLSIFDIDEANRLFSLFLKKTEKNSDFPYQPKN